MEHPYSDQKPINLFLGPQNDKINAPVGLSTMFSISLLTFQQENYRAHSFFIKLSIILK